jgi:hypothetical protein
MDSIVNNNKPKSNSDKLQELIYNYPSESKFHMYRNLYYGAAGIQLLIIILLVQVWDDSTALKLCLYSAAFGIPLWVCSGGLIEYYIFLGEQSYPHYKSKPGKVIFGSLYIISGISMVISIGSIMYSLNSMAVWIFGSSIVCVLGVYLIFNNSLANNLFKNDTKS